MIVTRGSTTQRVYLALPHSRGDLGVKCGSGLWQESKIFAGALLAHSQCSTAVSQDFFYFVDASVTESFTSALYLVSSGIHN